MLHKLVSKPLGRSEQERLVAAKLAWILHCSAPTKVILFGSAARGTMTTASDIDLIVIFATESDLAQARKSLYSKQPLDAWPHDLLLYSVASHQTALASGGGAAWLASQEGITLYPPPAGPT